MIDDPAKTPTNVAPIAERIDQTNSFKESAHDDGSAAQLPSKETLELEQLRLTNEKLKLEADKLREDIKPQRLWVQFVKNIVTIGGAVAVAASLYGIYDSLDKTIVDRERARIADQRARFEDAIKRLESTDTISKLVGVSVLSGYLDASNRASHRQILFTLAGLIATEKDPQTQAVVIDLFASIPKNGPISTQDWRYFQDNLVAQSRVLMNRDASFARRQQFFRSHLIDDENIAQAIGRLLSQNIRRGLVPDYQNYRGIYCVECDFSGATFPVGTDFSSSVLDRANFSSANLQDATFDNAGLAGTKFIETDLRGARFRSLDPESAANVSGGARLVFDSTHYLNDAVRTLDKNAEIYVVLPNFSCANLSDAHFEGSDLFPGILPLRRSFSQPKDIKPDWFQSVSKDLITMQFIADNGNEFSPIAVTPLKLFKANLKGAHFDESRFFGLASATDFGSARMSSSIAVSFNDLALYEGQMREEVFLVGSDLNKDTIAEPRKKELVDDFQRELRATFYMAKSDEAFLSKDLSSFLKRSPPTADDFNETFPHAISSGSVFDLDCKPRMPPHQSLND